MKYQDLANLIRKEISDGEFQHSDKLPTETELMDRYHVTRYCLRNAIDVLMKMGLVYAVQGSGMYIRQSKREGCLSLGSTRGVTGELPRHNITTEVLHLELRKADEELAFRMKCEVGTNVYYLIRKRKMDGQPLSIEYTYYNQNFIPFIDETIASGSLFSYSKKELGLNISFVDKNIYADKLPAQEAEWLGLLEGDPTMVIEDDVYLANGQMYNVSKAYYNYKIARFYDLAQVD